jgi:N-acetylneuraminate synthase
MKTNIIAEVGLNHLGQESLAREYVDKLVLTQVDGISFQVREPSFYEREEKKHLMLSEHIYSSLCKKVQKLEKQFGVAIADVEKIDFFESIGTNFYKIIRNDMVDDILVDKLMKTGKKIIVSTGLSSEEDIKLFLEKYGENKNFVLNHTQLSYEEGDCNLRAIEKLNQKYSVPISFGSHCANYNVLYMSLCFSPTDILFYVKKDDKIKYPDDKHAIKLEEVSQITYNIDVLSKATGTGEKIKLNNKIKGMRI